MARALGPRVGLGSDVAFPFALLGLCWLPVLGFGLVWLSGHAASLLSGHGWRGPRFGFRFAEQLLLDGGLAAAWPGVSPALVWAIVACAVLVAALALTPWVLALRRRAGTPGDPLRSLATERDVRTLTPRGVVESSRRLRPSLAATPGRDGIAGGDTGVALGRLRAVRGTGPELRASWEDVVLAVMAPRAGKTTALAVPALLDAPGAVVATSNKADLWRATAQLRSSDTDQRVWVFDPQAVAGVERSWWWNPLRGITTVEEAHRLAGHFVQEVRGDRGQRDFWTAAAHDLLSGLLLAAGLSGRTLVEVYEWLNDPVLPTAVQVLREHGQAAAASSLSGRQHGAPETREGVYETARTAAQCLRDPAILEWVAPPSSHGYDELDTSLFPSTRQSLYLLSKDGAGAAAPLVAALTDRVMRAAVRLAERSPGGRLDPPMVVVLDEAANVCRISDLPDLYSHLGSRGVVPMTILQSYRQGVRVWGEHGMDTLWSAATVKLLGAGLDDARLVEDVSRLVGEHDVAVRSVSRGDGRASESVSLRRQRVLPPEQLRALPKGSALLLATGCRPALVNLSPWYEGSRRADIERGSVDADRAIERGAGGPR